MKNDKSSPSTHNPFDKEGFKVSSSSSSAPYCVAVRIGDMIEVRDTKNPNSPTLSFSKGEWGAFVEGVKNNEFNT